MNSEPTVTMRRRLMILLLAFTLLLAALAARLGFIQIAQATQLQEKATAQWTRDLTITASRGDITDRNGTVLAQSANAWTILVAQQQLVSSKIKETAQSLADVLGLDADKLSATLSDSSKRDHIIKRQIDKETAEAVRALGIRGVHISADTTRKYPAADLASQVIGFTDISGQGQTGIEQEFDKYLKGVNGQVRTEVDRSQREMPYNNNEYTAPEHGKNIALTIDANIQYFTATAARKAKEETQAKKIWAAVMDLRTGELLSLVNEPSFDLNAPPRDDMEKLNQLTRNGFVADAYEPGSTFKIITTAAALEAGITNVNAGYNCTGSILVDGDKIRCWRTGLPHGHQTLTQAVMNSCNPVFVQLALGLGRDRFYGFLEGFGFGRKTGVSVRAESAGQVIAIKYVKDVDLARIGFGQSISVTPLQLLTAASAAVNGGKLLKPQIVKEISTPEGEVLQSFAPEVVGNPISEETSAVMRGILEEVVSDGGGRNAYIPGYRVGGKTGTAQKYDDSGRIMKDVHTSSFIGFAPMDDPRVAVLFVTDEPAVRPDYGSTVAAPYAREILEQTLPYLGVQPRYEEGEKELVGKQVEVPDMTQFYAGDAEGELEKVGLRALLDGERTNLVVDQMPAAGTLVPEQSIIVLYTNVTPEEEAAELNVLIPDVVGMTIVEANRMMRHAGLEMRIKGSGVAQGVWPAIGTEIERGSSVEVTFEPPKASEPQDIATEPGDGPEGPETPTQ